MTQKGSAGIAEQGSIGELRGDGPPASSVESTKAKSPSKAAAIPKETSFRDKAWSESPDDPPESFNTAIPDTVPMAKPKPTPVPGSLNPSAAAVAVPRVRALLEEPNPCHSQLSNPSLNLLKRAAW